LARPIAVNLARLAGPPRRLPTFPRLAVYAAASGIGVLELVALSGSRRLSRSSRKLRLGSGTFAAAPRYLRCRPTAR
jgi:hypothetical protein